MLKKEAFQLIRARWEVSIDLFTFHWNTQLEAFSSWKPQPGAMEMNAPSFIWLGRHRYALPLLSNERLLNKIKAGESDIDFSMHIMAELTLGSNSLSAFWRHHNSPPLPPRSTNVQSGGTPAAYNTINIYRSMRGKNEDLLIGPVARKLATLLA